MLPEASMVHDSTDFHTQGDQVQSLIRRISCQRSASAIGSHEIWNPYMVAAVATSERLSWQAVQCNHDRCAVTRLLAFCTHGTVNILNIHGHGRRCSTADAGEMWTHSSGIHTSLVAIRRGKTMRSDVIPNDKRRSSMSLHVAGLTSSRGPHVCPGTWLTLTVCRGDKYIATRRHACTHWPAPYNADRNFFLESVSAVSAELRYPLRLDRVPGIHRYFVHYGTRVAHVGPGWTTTQVLTSLVQHRTAKYFKDCNSIPAFFSRTARVSWYHVHQRNHSFAENSSLLTILFMFTLYYKVLLSLFRCTMRNSESCTSYQITSIMCLDFAHIVWSIHLSQVILILFKTWEYHVSTYNEIAKWLYSVFRPLSWFHSLHSTA